MTHWRYILHSVFLLVLAAGSAGAGTPVPAAGDGTSVCVEPAGGGLTAGAAAAPDNRELEGARIDDESLGRVSGGAMLFAPPDVARQKLFAIILWDEVKSRRNASYEQGTGQIVSTISVQQFK